VAPTPALANRLGPSRPVAKGRPARGPSRGPAPSPPRSRRVMALRWRLQTRYRWRRAQAIRRWRFLLRFSSSGSCV